MAGHILRDSFKPVDYKEGERSNLVLSEFHHIVDAAFLYTLLWYFISQVQVTLNGLLISFLKNNRKICFLSRTHGRMTHGSSLCGRMRRSVLSFRSIRGRLPWLYRSLFGSWFWRGISSNICSLCVRVETIRGWPGRWCKRHWLRGDGDVMPAFL